MEKFDSSYGRIVWKGETDIPVGTSSTWELIYLVGKKGIKEKGGIKIQTPGDWGWSRPQINQPIHGSEGYITTICSNSEAQLELEILRTRPPWEEGPEDVPVDPNQFEGRDMRDYVLANVPTRRLRVRVKGTSLKEGEKISITLGDVSRGVGVGFRAGTHPREEEISVWVDIEGTGNYEKLPSCPWIKLMPRAAKRVDFFAPSVMKAGEKGDFLVTFKDEFYNLASSYRGKIEFKVSCPASSISGLPQRHSFTKKDKGAHRFSSLRFKKEGIYRIEVKERKRGIKAMSNPVKVISGEGVKIFWGDLHVHSGLSDDNKIGTGMNKSPEECYEYARDVMGLDFMTTTDHHHLCSSLSPEEWQHIQTAAKSYNEEERFVAFPGFEYRCERGDTNVIFKKEGASGGMENKIKSFSPSPGASVPREMKKGIPSICELWKFYSEEEMITIPHLHPYSGKGAFFNKKYFKSERWECVDETKERLIEICSTWGRFEYYNNKPHFPKVSGSMRKGNTVQDLLKMGHKFGFTGGSDDHAGLPGHFQLTAVLAKELTRDALWEALFQRRCYATTGPRIIINFTADGHLMGEEYTASTSPNFHIEVIGSSHLWRVEIIRNGKMIYGISPRKEEIEFDFTDEGFKRGRQQYYYYLRVLQEDEHMAWSSPIFINYRGEK